MSRRHVREVIVHHVGRREREDIAREEFQRGRFFGFFGALIGAANGFEVFGWSGLLIGFCIGGPIGVWLGEKM